MKANEAFDAAIDYLMEQNHIVVLERSYDPDTFGNFIIGFTVYDEVKSIICDRGEIYLCDGLNGDTNCILVLSTIYDVEKEALIAALHRVK